MTEQELRALVREAIAKTSGGAGRSEDRQRRTTAGPASAGVPLATGHSSHALFSLSPGDSEGRCMIEPGVACNHCGYCKSYGH